MPLSPQELHRYEENGFLGALDLFTEEEIFLYRSQFDELEWKEGRETCRVGLQDCHFKERFIWKMVTDPRLLDLMQSVIGENLVLLGTHFSANTLSRKRNTSWPGTRT